jgi:hypothetical protein
MNYDVHIEKEIRAQTLIWEAVRCYSGLDGVRKPVVM